MYSVRGIKMDRAMTTTWNSQWNLEKNTVQCSVLWIHTSGAHTVRFRARTFGLEFRELHTSVKGHNIFHLLSPCCRGLLPLLPSPRLFSGSPAVWRAHTEPFWTHRVSSVCTREGIQPLSNPLWSQTETQEWACWPAGFGPFPRVKQAAFLQALQGSQQQSPGCLHRVSTFWDTQHSCLEMSLTIAQYNHDGRYTHRRVGPLCPHSPRTQK